MCKWYLVSYEEFEEDIVCEDDFPGQSMEAQKEDFIKLQPLELFVHKDDLTDDDRDIAHAGIFDEDKLKFLVQKAIPV